ncbi:MAG: HAD family hydrolase [Oscillospiraceae bacterium]|nr:HAD family hydrolase [Oscillospiraceae bacterium]
MQKLIIFDLDGTLFNSIADLNDAINHGLAKAGLPPIPQDIFPSLVGHGFSDLVKRSIPSEKLTDSVYQTVYNESHDFYDNHFLCRSVPYDGIPQMLLQLKNEGFKLAVCSNKPHSFVCEICREKFDDIFDMCLGKTDGLPLKPSAETVFKILRELNVSADHCIFVGDSDVDVKTAAAAKIPCIAVTWGYRPVCQLQKLHPTALANSVSELYETIHFLSLPL